MGLLQSQLQSKLEQVYSPTYFELENESHRHAVPAGAESHFRVVIVSSLFLGMSRVERARHVYETFKSEMQQGIHAFSQKCFTPSEWETLSGTLNLKTPNCMGQSEKK